MVFYNLTIRLVVTFYLMLIQLQSTKHDVSKTTKSKETIFMGFEPIPPNTWLGVLPNYTTKLNMATSM